MRLTLHQFLTLDGVMQAPGGPDEDTTSGFAHGGWTVPYADDEFGNSMVGWFQQAEAFLLGRGTYDIFASYWPHADTTENPIAEKLNALPKFVASTTLGSVEWHNSQLISGDVAEAVRKLREQPGGELQVHGSGGLAAYLIHHELIDEYRLLTFPVHLGTGKKLFADGIRPGGLKLLSSTATAAGVVISTYEAAGAPQYGTYEI